jgi:hypothetical protein
VAFRDGSLLPRARLLVYAVGSFGLALFFFWSAVTMATCRSGWAVVGLFGCVTTLVEASLQIKRRRTRASDRAGGSDT